MCLLLCIILYCPWRSHTMCSSSNLSLLFGVVFAQVLLHHLVNVAIQQEVYYACEIMASPLFLCITNCLDFGHWIAFNICYFLLKSELVESLFGVTGDIKSFNLLRLGAGYPMVCSLFCIGLALNLIWTVPFLSRHLEQVLQLGAGLAAASGLEFACWISWSHVSAWCFPAY